MIRTMLRRDNFVCKACADGETELAQCYGEDKCFTQSSALRDDGACRFGLYAVVFRSASTVPHDR